MPNEPAASAAVDPAVTPEAPAEPETADLDEFDRERAMSTIQKLREIEKQGKADAKARKELEAKLATYEAAQLTEAERQAKELADLQAQKYEWETSRQEARLEAAFYKLTANPDLGVADPELAYAVLNRDRIEYDDNGNPSNLPDLVTELLEAKPILRASTTRVTPGPPRLDGGAGHATPNGPTLTADQLEAAQMMGMSPERYAALLGKTVVADALKAVQPETST